MFSEKPSDYVAPKIIMKWYSLLFYEIPVCNILSNKMREKQLSMLTFLCFYGV